MTYWQKRLDYAQARLDHFKLLLISNNAPHLSKSLLERITFWTQKVEILRGRV